MGRHLPVIRFVILGRQFWDPVMAQSLTSAILAAQLRSPTDWAQELQYTYTVLSWMKRVFNGKIKWGHFPNLPLDFFSVPRVRGNFNIEIYIYIHKSLLRIIINAMNQCKNNKNEKNAPDDVNCNETRREEFTAWSHHGCLNQNIVGSNPRTGIF